MSSSKNAKKQKERSSKNREKKLAKLIAPESGDSGDESEHELSYYLKDRVKLMKEVLKIMKPKKIKAMAPDCMKNMDLQEINSILLEELLGISNKRLKYIFNGKTLDEESSTDEDEPMDVISLDDVSDDDFVVISDDDDPTGSNNKKSSKSKRKKIKSEHKDKTKKIKKEKPDKEKQKDKTRIMDKISRGETVNAKDKETIGEENLMTVLELLELQARARAIKSQLELESRRKREEKKKLEEEKKLQESGAGDDDEIIIEVPKEEEIVITSSDSENEHKEDNNTENSANVINEKIVDNENILPNNNNKESVANNDNNLEEGELSGSGDKELINNKPSVEKEQEPDDDEEYSSKNDSDSSNDNLEVIKRRLDLRKLKLKRRTEKENAKTININIPEEAASSSAIIEPLAANLEFDVNNAIENEPVSRIDEAVQDFIKANPPAPPSPKEPEVINEQIVHENEKKTKKAKEKRLKGLKGKLQSYKQDIIGESAKEVRVLENIIIQSKHSTTSVVVEPPNIISNQIIEDLDDLVINVDQDDLDCIICD